MDKDYIEFGGGNASKVIGKDNSVSEYMTVILALLSLMGQLCIGVFVVAFLVLYFVGLTMFWACVVAAVIASVPPFVVASMAFAYLSRVKGIMEPLPVRDEKGKFRRARVSSMGKHVGDIYTAENGETEYVDRWGGGG